MANKNRLLALLRILQLNSDSLMDQAIGKFGEDLEIKNVRRDTFDIAVPVSVSGTFYAWVFQFVGEMAIVSPGHVKDVYADLLQQAIDNALG